MGGCGVGKRMGREVGPWIISRIYLNNVTRMLFVRPNNALVQHGGMEIDLFAYC